MMKYLLSLVTLVILGVAWFLFSGMSSLVALYDFGTISIESDK